MICTQTKSENAFENVPDFVRTLQISVTSAAICNKYWLQIVTNLWKFVITSAVTCDKVAVICNNNLTQFAI